MRVTNKPTKASPELMKALDALLPPDEPLIKSDFTKLFGGDKEEIDNCLDKNDIIGAIRCLRNKNLMGLYEAKKTIEAYLSYRKEKKQWKQPTPASSTK